MKYRSLRFILASFLIGAFMVLSMPPWNIWPCAVVGFSLFYLLLEKVETRRGAVLYGWFFGFGYFVAGLWWIANALLVPGNPFKWVWPFTIIGLPALLAWFPAFAAFLCAKYPKRRLAGYLAFVAAFGLSEWLRGHAFSGYPWNSYGYTWNGWLAMAQVAALGGTYALSLLTVGWAALPGFLYRWTAPRRDKAVAVFLALLIFAACFAYGHDRLAANSTRLDPDVAVRPVQANISQADKWNPDKAADNLERELALTAPSPGDVEAKTTIVIWPETALDQDALRYPVVRDAVRRTLALYKNNVYLMSGLLRWVEPPGGGKETITASSSMTATCIRSPSTTSRTLSRSANIFHYRTGCR